MEFCVCEVQTNDTSSNHDIVVFIFVHTSHIQYLPQNANIKVIPTEIQNKRHVMSTAHLHKRWTDCANFYTH